MGLRGKVIAPFKRGDKRDKGSLRLPSWLRRRQEGVGDGAVVIDPLRGMQRMTPWGLRPMTERARAAYEKQMAHQPDRRERRSMQSRAQKIGSPEMRRAFRGKLPTRKECLALAKGVKEPYTPIQRRTDAVR